MIAQPDALGPQANFALPEKPSTCLKEQAEHLCATNSRLQARESELHMLTLIAERTDNAIILTDAAGRIIWVNEGFTRISGYTPDEAHGQFPDALRQGPDTDRRVTRRMGERLRRGLGFREEILNYRPDGTTYWLAIEVKPIHDDTGRITNFMAIERDITRERRTLQRQTLLFEVSQVLAEAESPAAALPVILEVICRRIDWQLGQAWTVSNDKIDLLSSWHMPSADYAHFTQSSRITTYRPGEGLRGSVWENQAPVWIADMQVAENISRVVAAEDLNLHGAFAFPVKVEGTPWCVLEFFSHCMEKPDDTLLQTMGSVAYQIGQFVARYNAQAALREAKELAEAENRERSQFVTTLSHEIRTPLNAVIGMTSLLALRPMETEQRGFLEVIQKASEQLLDVVNNVLKLARLEAQAQQNQSTDFDLDALIDHVMQIASGLPGAAALQLHTSVDADICRSLRGDSTGLKQVLINLLSNAIKFTEKGSVTLQVTQASGPDARPWLYFAVIDTGCGIPEKLQGQVFEPFEQADPGSDKAQKGTGLGLAICKRIVEQLGGTLYLHSTEDFGSTFTFFLPIERGDPVAPAPPSMTKHAPDDGPKSMRALVADDTPASQLIVRLMLERLGISVRSVNDGSDALTAYLEEAFDLVFLDIQMPRMNGYEAATAMQRSANSWPTPPIIGLSALSQVSDRDRALQHGMTHYLSKPIRFQDIVQLVEQITGQSSDSGHPHLT